MPTIQTPKFKQIKRRLIADIEAGVLPPGARIASESELIQKHGVARMTVVRSLNELVAEGYLVRIKGKGTFVRVHQVEGSTSTMTGVLALVVPELREGLYPSLVRGFDAAATATSHQVLLCNTDNDVRKQGDIILQLIDKHVSGVAMLPTTGGPASPHQVRQLQAKNIPVVFLHRGIEGASAPVLALPYEEVGALAARRMIEAGHRRAAVFLTHDATTTRMYEQGVRRVLAENNAELPDELVHCGKVYSVPADEHERGIESALERMLQLPRGRRPTAIFSGWDPEAALIYLLLGKMGVRVPDDISIITFGSVWRQGGINRRLSSVAVDEDEVGRTAVGLLGQMARPARPIDFTLQSVIPLHFHRGETLGAPPKSNRELVCVSTSR